MTITGDDWDLIVGLWDERDRLLERRVELKAELAQITRDLHELSDASIAKKMDVAVSVLYNLHPGYRVVKSTDSNPYR